MNDERVIAYLRDRGRVAPPHDLVVNVMAAVEGSSVRPSRFSAYLPAFVAVGAAAVVAVLALILGPGRDVGPAPSPSASAAAARPATTDELQEAIMAALDELKAMPGVEGIGTTHVLNEVGSASWFSWRPNGDQVVVNRNDIDVTETGWWRDPTAGPPARGVNISTTIQVLVGDDYYLAEGDVDDADRWQWATGLRSESPDVLGVPFPAALDAHLNPWTFAPTADGEATVASTADGGQVWTATSPLRDGVVVQAFTIGPDGALRSVSHELVGVSPTLDDRPITAASVDLIPLGDPDPIPVPDADVPPDPAAFGMPDLPLDAAGATIDYVDYIADALDYMEAYHWNTAEIDWAAARAAALDDLPADPDANQAYQRIQNAIATFDVFGTVFVRPQDVPPADDATAGSVQPPEAERMGDIGYVRLPTPPMSGTDALGEYLRAGRLATAAVEGDGPACGWIVDLRDHAGGAWGPAIAVLGGLLGEGRALTLSSGSAEWWLQVEADGLVSSAGFDDADVLFDSPYIDADNRGDRQIRDAFASEPPHLPALADAPIAVLIGNGTVTGGEQAAIAFIGRQETRVFGGPTGASPIVAPNVRMADGAVLRVPTWVPVDREGTRHTASILPDETVGDTRATGTDAVLDAARAWTEQQDACS